MLDYIIAKSVINYQTEIKKATEWNLKYDNSSSSSSSNPDAKRQTSKLYNSRNNRSLLFSAWLDRATEPRKVKVFIVTTYFIAVMLLDGNDQSNQYVSSYCSL